MPCAIAWSHSSPKGETRMRILAIGYPLPNVAIDNYNALTAPSYNDYDALIVDPASITRVAKELASGEAQYDAFDDRDRSFGNANGGVDGTTQPLTLRCLVLHNVIQVAHAPRWLHRQHELLRLSEDSPRRRPLQSTISVVDASLLARRTSA